MESALPGRKESMNNAATLTDHYPTRVDHSEIHDRHDPVVWPGRSGPWPDGAVDDFAARGFRSVEGVLGAGDIRDVRAEIDAVTTRLGTDERVIRETSDGSVRSVFAVHELSEKIASIIAREEIAGVARQLLGDDVYVHQSRVNLKPGFAGGPFYWHSDFETWHAEDGMPAMHAVSASIARPRMSMTLAPSSASRAATRARISPRSCRISAGSASSRSRFMVMPSSGRSRVTSASMKAAYG